MNNDPLLDHLRDPRPSTTRRARLRRQARVLKAAARSALVNTLYSLVEPAWVALVIVVYAGWGLATIASLF